MEYELYSEPSSLASSINSSGSYCASDDRVAKTIRDKLREYRVEIIGFLQERLTLAFLNAILLVQLITEREIHKVQSKHHQTEKTSCLVDMIAKKRGTDLKVFVDQLRTHCPAVHNMLHEPDNENDGGEMALRNTTEKLQQCLHDTHFGVHRFVQELAPLKLSGVDITKVIFANGNSVLHEIIQLEYKEYLTAIHYTGFWSELVNLRTKPGSSVPGVTPGDLGKKLKRSKMGTALVEINALEAALHEVDRCVRAGNVSLFRELKQMYRPYITERCSTVSDGVSLLEYACQSGQLLMLIEVIRTEQDLGHRSTSVDKALALCVEMGHHLLLKTLMEYVPVDINQVTVDGKSLMEQCSYNGDIETFRELQLLGAQPTNAIIANGAARNRLPFLQELFRDFRSYNINFQDKRKKCALHFAAEKGNTEIVRLLLEKGCDINLKDKRSFTILHSAVSSGSLSTVEAVLAALDQGNARHMLNKRDRYLGSEQCFLVRGRDHENPAWHYIIVDRARIDIFRCCIHEGTLDVANYGTVLKSGWGAGPTPTIIQEIEGRFDMANVRSDMPPDQQPLHLGIMKNHETVSLKLISIMEDVGQQDYFGLTPLHLAAMRGSINVIKALLGKGADRTLRDNSGRTPFDIAMANKHQTAMTELTPAAQKANIEGYRDKLLSVYHNLSQEELDRCTEQGQDTDRRIKTLLREVVADTNDALFIIGAGPTAQEGAVGGRPGARYQ